MPPVGPYVFAYFDQLSVTPGDTIGLHLSSSAAEIEVSVYRLGAERRLVLQQTVQGVSEQAIPDRASSDGCGWPRSVQWEIPADWSSGYYEAALVTASGDARSTAFFVVRSANPGQDASMLLVLATNTYNAYTNWGGHSLYMYHDRDGLQGHRVSFDRPLASQFGKWELPFVAWAEQHGYRLDFAVNTDLELRPELLRNYKLMLSVGHDEYWSSPMRDTVESFIAAGGNVAFFSGNTCCWQVRTEDEGRALTCWKQWYNTDPLFRSDQEHLLSTLWSHHRVGRPENRMTGVGFLWGGYHLSHGQFTDGSGGYTVHRQRHWVFEGTGLQSGDELGGANTIVGYECDGCEMVWHDGLPFPTGRDGTPQDFVILATAPARWAPGDCYWYERFPKDRVGAAVMGVYQREGTVFTCGSTDWAHGLSGGDPAVERITRNILDRLGAPD
ncbi:MAG: hypothetical protein D6753_09590 [Planctomycetota bacterium]|nr:MAG: hypothetical protein D6753_09590 [Planctomycetota bacterium]